MSPRAQAPSIGVRMGPEGDSHVEILVDHCRTCTRVRRWVLGNWRERGPGHPWGATEMVIWVDSMTAGGIGIGVGVALHHTWGIAEEKSHQGVVSAHKLVGGGGGWLMVPS